MSKQLKERKLILKQFFPLEPESDNFILQTNYHTLNVYFSYGREIVSLATGRPQRLSRLSPCRSMIDPPLTVHASPRIICYYFVFTLLERKSLLRDLRVCARARVWMSTS